MGQGAAGDGGDASGGGSPPVDRPWYRYPTDEAPNLTGAPPVKSREKPRIRALCQATWLQGVAMLDLQNNPLLGDAGLAALAGCGKLGSLTTLYVAGSGGTGAGYAALVLSGRFRALREIQGGYDAAGDLGAGMLTGLPALQDVTLESAGVTALGARALLEYAGLRVVALGQNPLGGLGAVQLSPQLESLRLKGCGLGPSDAVALAEAPAPALRFLVLTDNPLGDEGIRALAHAGWLGQLTALEVVCSGASAAALAELPAAWGTRRGLTAS